MRRHPRICTAPLLLASNVAYAEVSPPSCEELERLTTHAASNFITQPANVSGADKCRSSVTLTGARAFHCSWQFPYRDSAAVSAFDAFESQLRACFSYAEMLDDIGVNHPDTYRLHALTFGGVIFTISMKDKIELGETYVFLGIHGTTIIGPSPGID